MTEMNENRFAELAEAFGADLAKWPEAERQAAAQLMAEIPSLVTHLRDAAVLDDLLSGLMPEPIEQAPGHRQRPVAPVVSRLLSSLRPLWPFDGLWQPATGLVAASLAGFLLGLTGNELPPELDSALNEQLTFVEIALGADGLEIDQ